MEELKSVKNKQKNKGLSKQVQNYSNAIIFSVATILGVQSSNVIADNLLSDSTLQISEPIKENPDSVKYKDDFLKTLTEMMIESNYNQIEKNEGTIKVIEQKLNDKCNNGKNKCDISKEIEFYKIAEKEIISYFKDDITPGINVLTIKLNRLNTGKILDLFIYLENIFKARFGEKYMDVLNKETIKNAIYNLEIEIKLNDNKYTIMRIEIKK